MREESQTENEKGWPGIKEEKPEGVVMKVKICRGHQYVCFSEQPDSKCGKDRQAVGLI